MLKNKKMIAVCVGLIAVASIASGFTKSNTAPKESPSAETQDIVVAEDGIGVYSSKDQYFYENINPKTESISTKSADASNNTFYKLNNSDYLFPIDSNNSTLDIIYQDGESGIRIPAEEGQEIFAITSGTIINVEESRSDYGNKVQIKNDDGTTALYGFMSKTNATVGDIVNKGDVIGYVGRTGIATGYQCYLEICSK